MIAHAHELDLRVHNGAAGGWLQPLRSWPQGVLDQLDHHEAVVRVLVAGVRGSAPREAGACMLVTPQALYGTIGGGHLEWQALQAARALPAAEPARLQRVVLGTELGQCCGGVVELWLERWTRAERPLLRRIVEALDDDGPLLLHSELDAQGLLRRRLDTPTPSGQRVRVQRGPQSSLLSERLDSEAAPVWLFGAGHVGQALARVLAELPFRLHWVDARPGVFPAELPDGIRVRATAPLEALRAAAPGGRYVVMTHDHALDYALVRAILQRGDARYLGLIGSDSKAARFRSRLARDGYSATQVAGLTCPIGIAGIASKLPAAIAVGIAAQLLQTLEAPQPAATTRLPQVLSECGHQGCDACQTTS